MFDNRVKPKIIFPVFDTAKDTTEREIIQIFLQRFRDIDTMRFEVKVLSAIHKTADLTGNSDGLITRILVDNGLRASRECLPEEFLEHIDMSAFRQTGGIKVAYEDLKAFWMRETRNRFSFLHSPSFQNRLPSFMTV